MCIVCVCLFVSFFYIYFVLIYLFIYFFFWGGVENLCKANMLRVLKLSHVFCLGGEALVQPPLREIQRMHADAAFESSLDVNP